MEKNFADVLCTWMAGALISLLIYFGFDLFDSLFNFSFLYSPNI